MQQEYKCEALIPAIIQDSQTGKVLMLGYMNKESLDITKESGRVTFFSRSKQRLWTKGESSGNFLLVKKILTDCDNDTLLIKAEPTGTVCHTGSDTCFGEENKFSLAKLESIIADRKANPNSQSYTSRLFASGINKIAQKVGEETVELVIESKDNNNDGLLNEAADLLYHYLVLLTAKDVTLEQVVEILAIRNHSAK
jgi:phosphoribosyl-ATP pyrophosphohydrolase/phosphoribosyl-AMP cyclohydrolase